MFKKPKKVRGVRGGPVEVMDMEEEDEEEVVEIQTNINKIKKEKKKKKDKDKEKKEEKKTSSLLSFDEEAGENDWNRTRVADLDQCSFKESFELWDTALLRIRDLVPFPGSGMGKKSRSGMNISDHTSESVENIFWVKNT
jgi:hypothetical protein